MCSKLKISSRLILSADLSQDLIGLAISIYSTPPFAHIASKVGTCSTFPMYGIDCRGFVQQKPKTALAFSWIVWKSLLLFLALTSPGVGYDTSTDVLFAAHDNRSQPFIYGLKKLIRWDAVYFSQIARRGYLFEQEWAFGWGFTRVLSLGGNGNSCGSLALILLTAKLPCTSVMVSLASLRPWSAYSSLTSPISSLL